MKSQTPQTPQTSILSAGTAALARALPVLMYHHVCPAAGLVTISPQNFAEQMQFLAENGWTSLGLADLARFLAGEPIPKKSVVITFDDGYLDNWLFAHPVLQRYGLKAVLFAVTAWLGDGAVRDLSAAAKDFAVNHRACMQAVAKQRHDDVMMRWSEIEAVMAAQTFEIHSHTHTHTRWDQVFPADKNAKIEHLHADLSASCAALKQRLGFCAPHLCWPQGYFDADYIATAKALGWSHLYTTEAGTVTRQNSLPERLPRIVVKDKPASWLKSRLFLYQNPHLAAGYQWLKERF